MDKPTDITIIPTSSGGFNIFGVYDDVFIIQGHLSLEQLRQLKAEVDKTIAITEGEP